MAKFDQKFAVAGITTDVNGVIKVRYTDDLIRRTKMFAKGGCSRIDLTELPEPMLKIDAIKFLMTVEQFSNPSDLATLSEALEYQSTLSAKREGSHVARPRGRPRKTEVSVKVKVPKATKAVTPTKSTKTTKTTKTTVSLDDIKSRVSKPEVTPTESTVSSNEVSVADILSAVGIKA